MLVVYIIPSSTSTVPREYRELPDKARSPLKELFCTTSDTGAVAGARCRGEGGCHSKERQCLAYFLSAPFFHFNLQFLVSDKLVFKEIEMVLKETDKIKKIKNKVSDANTDKRREYDEVYLKRTFKVLITNSINHIKSCPVLWAAKKASDVQLVEGFLSFPPVRQVVMNSQLPFREAVKQRLEEQEQIKQQQERRAARVRNQEELRHDNNEGEGGFEKLQSGGAASDLCRVEVRGARPPPCLLTWRQIDYQYTLAINT
jgi:hypothetical protein